MSTPPLSIQQFASTIRAKHPKAYDDLSDAQLTKYVLDTYPQYKDMVASYTPTQFEKDRPGKGVTPQGIVKGAGTAIGQQVKSLSPGADFTSVESALIGHPSFDPSQSGIAQAYREGKAGFERGGIGEAIPAALGSLMGVSAQRQAEHAAKGEGGEIIGELGVPAAEAIAAYGAPKARGAIGKAIHTPAGELTSGAKLAGEVGGGLVGTGVGGTMGHPYIGAGAGYKMGPRILSRMFPPGPPPPEFPGAPLPSTEEFYEQRGKEINQIYERHARQAAKEAKAAAKKVKKTPVEQASSVVTPEDAVSQDLITRTKPLVRPGEPPTAAELKRAGDLTQVPLETLKRLAKFGDKLAQNELVRRLRQ